MKNRIRVFEADSSLIEVNEYTNEDIPFLYTVIFDIDGEDTPRVESYHVELEHGGPDFARNQALDVFNRRVIEFVTQESQLEL